MEGLDFSVAPDIMETPDTSVAEVEETPVEETAETTPEVDETEEITDGQGTEEAAEPKDIKKAVLDYLKNLKAQEGSDPKVIKELRDRFMREQAYNEVGDIHALRDMRAQLDAVGGPEGLAEMQSTLAAIEETDALLDQGDPQVLEQIFQDSPEGAVKLAGPYLSKVQKANPEAFRQVMMPHVMSTLDQANFPGVVDYLIRATADNEEVQKVLGQMKTWYADNKRASETFRSDSLAPERDKLREERSTLEQERRRIFLESVQGDAMNAVASRLRPHLQPYDAFIRTLPVGQQKAIGQAIYDEMQRAMDADNSFQRGFENIMASKRRDRSALVRHYDNKAQSLAETVVRQIAKDYGLKAGVNGAKQKTAARTPTGKGSPSAPVRVSKRPDDSNLDLEKTTSDMLIRGMGYLKSGSFVRWR